MSILGLIRPALAEESSPAEPGHHCLEQDTARWVYHSLLAGQYNTWGAEYTGELGICIPFAEAPGMLWEYTALEIGTLHYLSPAYLHLGGYLQLSPISPLVLRAELSWVRYWVFPLDRAAYFPRSGYDDDLHPSVMPPEIGESANGWNLNLMAIARAQLDLGPVGLIVLDVLSVEFWNLGEADYYANLRRELVLARSDWALANEAMLLVDVPLTAALSLRVGAYDTLRYGINSGDINNNVGLMVMANWPVLGRSVRNLAPFFRLGFYTNRPFDDGIVTLYLGAVMDLDLSNAAERPRER